MLTNQPPAELADNLWMLGTREYPVYLDRGDGPGTLFEGGIGPLGPVLKQQFEDRNVGAADVNRIVVTHAHPDHVMAVPALKQMFPGAEVVGSPLSSRALAEEKTVAFFQKLDGMLAGSLRSQGLVEGEEPAVAPEENHIAIDRVVGEGDSIEVGPGTAYQVLETPGHSPCSLSFFDPERKVLIISDASGYYMPTHNDWWPNYFSDYGQYVASLERLAGLGAEVLCLSHNGAIRGADDVAAYFQGAIEATRRYHGRIVDEAATGKSPREIGEMLGTEIHEKTPLLPVDFFQKNCGLMAKLSLQHEKAAG